MILERQDTNVQYMNIRDFKDLYQLLSEEDTLQEFCDYCLSEQEQVGGAITYHPIVLLLLLLHLYTAIAIHVPNFVIRKSIKTLAKQPRPLRKITRGVVSKIVQVYGIASIPKNFVEVVEAAKDLQISVEEADWLAVLNDVRNLFKKSDQAANKSIKQKLVSAMSSLEGSHPLYARVFDRVGRLIEFNHGYFLTKDIYQAITKKERIRWVPLSKKMATMGLLVLKIASQTGPPAVRNSLQGVREVNEMAEMVHLYSEFSRWMCQQILARSTPVRSVKRFGGTSSAYAVEPHLAHGGHFLPRLARRNVSRRRVPVVSRGTRRRRL